MDVMVIPDHVERQSSFVNSPYQRSCHVEHTLVVGCRRLTVYFRSTLPKLYPQAIHPILEVVCQYIRPKTKIELVCGDFGVNDLCFCNITRPFP